MKKAIWVVLLLTALLYPAAAVCGNCCGTADASQQFEDSNEGVTNGDIQWLNITKYREDVKIKVDLYDGQGAANPTVALTFLDTDNDDGTGKTITGLGVYGADKVVIVVWWEGGLITKKWKGAGLVFDWENGKWKYNTYLSKNLPPPILNKDLEISGGDSFEYCLTDVNYSKIIQCNVIQYTSDPSSPKIPSVNNITSFIENNWYRLDKTKLELNYDENKNEITVELKCSGDTLTAAIMPADMAPKYYCPNPPIPELPPVMLVAAGLGLLALAYRRR